MKMSNHEINTCLDVVITQNGTSRRYDPLPTKGGNIELVNQDLEAFNNMTFSSIEYMLGVLQEKVNTKEIDNIELSYRIWRYEKDFKI
jgi:hypothetical protein